MRYYKIIYNGYIQRIGIGDGGVEISQEEYQKLTDVIQNKHIAENGYDYKLKENLTWELYELPKITYEEYQATEEDYLNALNELGVDTDA